ncbi:MAG: processing protein [Pseudonocardiales bacterium]|jgi:DNA processing protein|nr:processing protein [Pseudonocardiales bacterium]
MGGVSDEVLLARAFLNRVAEPASIPVWNMVRRDGAVEAARAIRDGTVDDRVSEATAARAAHVDPYADLEAAQRHGIRLVVPESDEWPHFAFAALEATALRRLETYTSGQRKHAEGGELIPPLALWVRGTSELSTVGVRSAALVGARAATEYGERVARELACGLAERGFVVVSGGAYGIDAAAHRGALAADRDTVIVSAGGLDRAYPPGNTTLFERVAESGLLVSESPPGSAPQRRRFLTRNRLIAALGTGTVVVEAARRSGAMNTAHHCTGLGRPLMAVPGPVTSAMSVGCHTLIAADTDSARLVTGLDDVLLTIGSASDLPVNPSAPSRSDLTSRLDQLDQPARQVFDGFPARGWVHPDRLAVRTGLSPLTVIRALPILELSGLIEVSDGGYRIVRPVSRSPSTQST